ncbi:hypothetical protein J7413_08895 [Shimia sp. R10_1]|uniref:hypothetical protein n=1 Tax=Shimia sp. R10_1 TaxID=2821095 RepID=UPI001ADCF97B|nr:hypothetical protein [Shimia sp. R10_1]MBO9473652.1 hypothetical protein [Shimia sp. R10_1]
MAERGIYGEFAFVGVAAGIDDENGFTISVYMSASLGVSADRWGSASIRGGLEGWTSYL